MHVRSHLLTTKLLISLRVKCQNASEIKQKYLDQWILHDPPHTHTQNLQQVAESGTNALNVDHISQQSQEFDKKQRIVKKKKKETAGPNRVLCAKCRLPRQC